MKSARMLVLGTAALLCLAPLAAQAEVQEIQGRTGLPVVQQSQEKVWLDRGVANLTARDGRLYTEQTYRLHYPGPPLETGPITARVAVREDYYRSGDAGAPITTADARGFDSFQVYIDGNPVPSMTGDWSLNTKKDTATRWRSWDISFRPDQFRTLRIVTVAPLGDYGGHPTVGFITKDLGHWRDKPEYLRISLATPGISDVNLVSVDPAPRTTAQHDLTWIYRKANPNRDVVVELPGTAAQPTTF